MRQACRGFTLLEMMVVMVLIGVLLGMVSLVSGANPARQARQDANTLIQVLQALREHAVLEGREYGLRIDAEGYQVMRLDGRSWHAVGRAHRLAQGLHLGLESPEHTSTLTGYAHQPQLLVLSSDEYTAFTLHLLSAQQPLASLSSDGLSEVALDE